MLSGLRYEMQALETNARKPHLSLTVPVALRAR